MGPEGAKHISYSLKCNLMLKSLNLSITILHIDGNNIRTEGTKFISEALKKNTTLTSLSLGITQENFRRK